MPRQFICGGCLKAVPTSDGLRSHLGQSPDCQKEVRAQGTADRKQVREERRVRQEERRIHREERAERLAQWRNERVAPFETVDETDHDVDPFDLPEELHRDDNPPSPGVPPEVPLSGGEGDEDNIVPSFDPIHTERYPGSVAEVLGQERTRQEEMRDEQLSHDHPPWHPFSRVADWNQAKYLMKSGLSGGLINEFFGLETTKENRPSSHNARSLLQKIDRLPHGADWKSSNIKVTGSLVDADGHFRTEYVELWKRNPVEVVRELLGNPDFAEHISFEPVRNFSNAEKTDRVYGEMNSAEWWWETQIKLPSGATIASIILSSDQTKLSEMSGDKKAWPVYITLGNIDKDIRRKPSRRATLLLGYLPVAHFANLFHKDDVGLAERRLFHYCMAELLQPLIKAGQEGVHMTCPDGCIHLVFPILAAYIADYPEQCLITGCRLNRCPICPVSSQKRGDFLRWKRPRDSRAPYSREQETVAEFLRSKAAENEEAFSAAAADEGFFPIEEPFWALLPHTNIFRCITPDLLHQLHKGVFKDHLVGWCQKLATKPEIDARFQAMPKRPGMRHFKNGISKVKQWTGKEYRGMQNVFAALLPGCVEPGVVRFARAILDFIYLASYPSHSTTTLAALEHALRRIHSEKEILIKLGIRKHFNIPKFHMLLHYIEFIKWLGCADGYNTENSERMHIDLVKNAYNASNKNDYYPQMTLWLQRQEAAHWFANYIHWATSAADWSDSESDSDSDSESSYEETEDDDDAAVAPESPMYLALKPAFGAQTLSQVEARFQLPELTAVVRDWLHKQKIAYNWSSTDRIDIWRKVSIMLPNPQSFVERQYADTVRASPPASTVIRGLRHNIPPRFDTVIIHWDDSAEATGMRGYRVGQVCLIFQLPPRATLPRDHLVFLRWFTVSPTVAANVLMHRLSKPLKKGVRECGIVPLATIRRSAHLVPEFGAKADRTWRAEQVLEQANTFFLNAF